VIGTRIERASPAFVKVAMSRADVRGVDFLAFRRPNKFDLTGLIEAPAQFIESIEVGMRSAPNAR
jgi:hypothetical protein